VTQIRTELGPEAVVLNVRKVEASGWGRFWQKPRLEVLACRPERPSATAAPSAFSDEVALLRKELTALKEQLQPQSAEYPARLPARSIAAAYANVPAKLATLSPAPVGAETRRWRVELLLENAGLQPLQIKRLLDIVQANHGEAPPPALADELALTRQALVRFWREPPRLDSLGGTHILIGPAGSGKTTALCKWLTQAVLVEGRRARVWRLDGASANNAEFLTLHGEILGVQTERAWQPGQDSADLHFIDLPGVDWRNPAALRALQEQVQRYDSPQLHLVLNAAYDVPVLLAQMRVFESFSFADLIFTHLDEEPRWGKLWNFMLGTNHAMRFLSAGQNIPGQFHEATAEQLLNRLFP
jgi:flagellar biosynthesis protein FlhF